MKMIEISHLTRDYGHGKGIFDVSLAICGYTDNDCAFGCVYYDPGNSLRTLLFPRRFKDQTFTCLKWRLMSHAFCRRRFCLMCS